MEASHDRPKARTDSLSGGCIHLRVLYTPREHRGCGSPSSVRDAGCCRPIPKRNGKDREALWLAEMSSAESCIDSFLAQARTLSLHLTKSSFGQRARALNLAMRFPAAHTSTGRTQIIKDGRKGLRARPPDHNGGATHPVDHGK